MMFLVVYVFVSFMFGITTGLTLYRTPDMMLTPLQALKGGILMMLVWPVTVMKMLWNKFN